MAYFIEFIDVHKTFDDGRKVLDGISFGVETGETFAILGPSGVGKTVTLTHVVGLLKPALIGTRQTQALLIPCVSPNELS